MNRQSAYLRAEDRAQPSDASTNSQYIEVGGLPFTDPIPLQCPIDSSGAPHQLECRCKGAPTIEQQLLEKGEGRRERTKMAVFSQQGALPVGPLANSRE